PWPTGPATTPPAAGVRPERVAELLTELHPWDVPAVQAVQTWAKVVTVPSRRLPDLTVPSVADVPALRPGTTAGYAYRNATSHALLRASISQLLAHTYVVDVGGRRVTVGFDLTSATRLDHGPDVTIKARRYQPGDEDVEARAERTRGFDHGGGPEGGGGVGPDPVLARLQYETGRAQGRSAEGSTSATVEHNREATRPYRYYRFDVTVSLRGPDGRELRVDVPDGLIAMLPVTDGALDPEILAHLGHLFAEPPPGPSDVKSGDAWGDGTGTRRDAAPDAAADLLDRLPPDVVEQAVRVLQSKARLRLVIGDDPEAVRVRAVQENAVAEVARALYNNGGAPDRPAAEAAAAHFAETSGTGHACTWTGIQAGARKKKPAGPPRQSPGEGSGSGRGPLPEQHARPATSQEPPTAANQALSLSERQALRRAGDKVLGPAGASVSAARRADIMTAARRTLEQLPRPADLPMELLVAALRDVSPVLREQLVSHPAVSYAAIHGEGLTLLLRHRPALVAALDDRPALLEALVAARPGWYGGQYEAMAEILLREPLLRALETDPALRGGVFDWPGVLVHLDGRQDLLSLVTRIGRDVQELASTAPQFGEALLSLPQAGQAMWGLGAEASLTSALKSRLAHGARYAAEFYRTLLTDDSVRSVLRAHPMELQVALGTPRSLMSVRANPRVLGLLSRSPALTDVLEGLPELAERLLADEHAMEAAVGNPAVAHMLSYDPARYATVADESLRQALADETMTAQAAGALSLTPTQIAAEPVLMLLGKLKAAFPAVRVAYDRLSREQMQRLLGDDWLVRLLARVLAGRPDAVVLPHIVRRLRDLPQPLVLPEDDDTALTIAIAATRHASVYDIYTAQSYHAVLRLPLNDLVRSRPEFGDLLVRAPALSFLALHSVRMFTVGPPLDQLAGNPWLAATMEGALLLGFGEGEWTLAQAGDAALLRLLHRYMTLQNDLDRWKAEAALSLVSARPETLRELVPVFGALSSTHWLRLLTDGEGLYELLGEWRHTPTGEALVTLPDVLREAVARSGFADAWRSGQQHFDQLSGAAVRAAAAPADSRGADGARQPPPAVEKLLRAIRQAGPLLVSEDGIELDPELLAAARRLLPRNDGEAFGLDRAAFDAALGEQAASTDSEPAEVFDRYRVLAGNAQLGQVALRRPELAQGLLFTPDLATMLVVRPSLLELVRREPDVLRQLMQVEGLPALLARDDTAFEIYAHSHQMRANVDDRWVWISTRNPDYLTLFKGNEVPALRSASMNLWTLLQDSPVLARRTAAEPRLAEVFNQAEALVRKLLELENEDVVRAVTAVPGRLSAAVAAPESVSVLAGVPGLMSALADTPDVVVTEAEWRVLATDADLLARLTAYPGLARTVMSPAVLPVVRLAPAFVDVLGRTPPHAREHLVLPAVLRLVASRPALAAHLASPGGEGLRRALTGLRALPGLLADRADLLEGLRRRPELAEALRLNRRLLDEAAQRTPVWSVIESHPELAGGLGHRLGKALRRHPEAARAIAAHRGRFDAEVLLAALRSPGLPAMLDTSDALASAFLDRPRWQVRAARDPEFPGAVRRLAADD
ncbi:hypothetical protein ACWDBO_55265, partial [Streptomyces mirabilis]